MKEAFDRVEEFSAGRSMGDPHCYVVDNSRRAKIAMIPLDIGEMPDQLRIASRISAALNRNASAERRESDIWTSGMIVGFCAGIIMTLIVGLLFAAIL